MMKLFNGWIDKNVAPWILRHPGIWFGVIGPAIALAWLALAIWHLTRH